MSTNFESLFSFSLVQSIVPIQIVTVTAFAWKELAFAKKVGKVRIAAFSTTKRVNVCPIAPETADSISKVKSADATTAGAETIAPSSFANWIAANTDG